ncbi:hypothetical protein J1N35_022183 [Gossypium stocksii]|uniref:Uncharacterized protein n=1 Tax=Gossypium stocksii TaxID=47602 RepID=A0A9D3VHP1_9ROSI|nr:hypothetical protein J1N35_022183 [Gossypium stocksii]
MNPANEENALKALEEQPGKTKSISIEIDNGDDEEANPSVAPLVDSTTAVPPPFAEQMIERDEIVEIVMSVFLSMMFDKELNYSINLQSCDSGLGEISLR